MVETIDADGDVLHRLDGPPPPTGAEVTGELDWNRRYMLMRYHTATHVLCGVMFNDYGVITSYSIHYTKLYESLRKERDASPARPPRVDASARAR